MGTSRLFISKRRASGLVRCHSCRLAGDGEKLVPESPTGWQGLMAEGQLVMPWPFAPAVPRPAAEMGLGLARSGGPAAPLPAATIDAGGWRHTGKGRILHPDSLPRH